MSQKLMQEFMPVHTKFFTGKAHGSAAKKNITRLKTISLSGAYYRMPDPGYGYNSELENLFTAFLITNVLPARCQPRKSAPPLQELKSVTARCGQFPSGVYSTAHHQDPHPPGN